MDTNKIVTTSYTTPLCSNWDPTTGGLEDDVLFLSRDFQLLHQFSGAKHLHFIAIPCFFSNVFPVELNFPVIKWWGGFDHSGLHNSSPKVAVGSAATKQNDPFLGLHGPPSTPCEDVEGLAPIWCTSTCCQHSASGSNDIWKKCPEKTTQQVTKD